MSATIDNQMLERLKELEARESKAIENTSGNKKEIRVSLL